ncbi:MAG: SIS domain-containing protein [Thermoprotei archaeon]|nr:MAG: SIS domain-containing protein [Thermoprotei archaeon]
MGADAYLKAISEVIEKIRSTQLQRIREAAEIMASSMEKGGVVHVFGTGHSMLPVLDIFPRYGSFLGFHPMLDPRLLIFGYTGLGGPYGVLWLEHNERYVEVLLKCRKLEPRDAMLLYSHSGGTELTVALARESKKAGLPVVAVTSYEAQKKANLLGRGKRLPEYADVVIDDCVPLEDALVRIEGQREPVAAGSTVAMLTINSALVAEVAKILVGRGVKLVMFNSPYLEGVTTKDLEEVLRAYQKLIRERGE